MKRVQTDVAVGLFVLASFGILMWGSVQIGALRDWVDTEGRRVVVRFDGRDVLTVDDAAPMAEASRCSA